MKKLHEISRHQVIVVSVALEIMKLFVFQSQHLNVIFRFMAAHSATAFVEKFKCLVKFTLLIFYTISRSIIGVIRRVIDDMPQAQTSFSSPRCSEGLSSGVMWTGELSLDSTQGLGIRSPDKLAPFSVFHASHRSIRATFRSCITGRMRQRINCLFN